MFVIFPLARLTDMTLKAIENGTDPTLACVTELVEANGFASDASWRVPPHPNPRPHNRPVMNTEHTLEEVRILRYAM